MLTSAGARVVPQSPQQNDPIFIVAGTLAVGVALYALAALFLGWGLRMEALVRHTMTNSAMVPASALCFILSGFAMLAALGRRERATRLLCALLTVLVLLTMLCQTLSISGPTRLYFGQTEASERMAPITALAFLLFVWAADRLLRRAYFVVECVGIFGVSGAIGLILMKLTGVTDLPGLGYTDGISLQSAILAGLLFLALSVAAYQDERDSRVEEAERGR